MKTKTTINSLIGLTLLLLSSVAAISQTKQRKYPMPGDTLADHTFTDLLNYPKTTAKISDFRGKWLILDFWGYSCSGCIASFPRMNALSQQFKDKNVQLIMVGATKSSNNSKPPVDTITMWTKKLYKRQDMLHHLKFTVAFDSVLFLKHNVGALPHILIIDPNGVIKAKTGHVDSAQIAALLAGKSPKFQRKFSADETSGYEIYDKKTPLLTNGGAESNGGIDTSYIYRSMLVPWDQATMQVYSNKNLLAERKYSDYIDVTKSINVEANGYNLEQLLRLAYFGRSAWDEQLYKDVYGSDFVKVLNETGDKSIDRRLVDERYSYSLRMPPTDSITSVMRVIQEDLKRVFPYRAKLETRNLPAYRITVANASKLNSRLKDKKTGETYGSVAYDGVFKVRNMDFNWFLIRGLIGLMHTDNPVFDQTGIKNKFIDVDFPSDMQSKESIIRGMEKIGFKVEVFEKPMRVLVLR